MNLESPDSGRRPPLEPVLPLINVVFLLLIFFMLASTFLQTQTLSVIPGLPDAQGCAGRMGRRERRHLNTVACVRQRFGHHHWPQRHGPQPATA